MNLDDLMAVWRSQDAAPLHGVNKTLLHLALRQEEAKLEKAAAQGEMDHVRLERVVWSSPALFFAMMIYLHRHRPDKW